LAGGSQWQNITLNPADFRNASDKVLSDWNGIKELELCAKTILREKTDEKENVLNLGAEWKGSKPEIRKLCWILDSRQHEK
jgi:hypothetical protein